MCSVEILERCGQEVFLRREEQKTLKGVIEDFFTDSVDAPFTDENKKVWSEISLNLTALGRNVNAFVPQDVVNAFLERLIELQAMRDYKIITACENVTVPSEVRAKWNKANKKIGKTVRQVKEVLKHKHYSKGTEFCIKNTPSGLVKVRVYFDENRVAKAKMILNPIVYPTEIDIFS